MHNAPFRVKPISGAIGAELQGIDLSTDLPDGTIAAIRQALLDHLVIFFRDQDVPPARFLALARRFGTPIEYPFVKGIDGFPDIINVAKLEHEKINFGGVWHSDTTYLQDPPMATLLIAREVPDAGGDTLFANQYLAYETLSDKLRTLLADLKGVSSSAKADASRTREDRIKTDRRQR
jgi:taurine dioxygenase